MKKLTLILSVFLLLAFTPKNEAYFRQNIAEANRFINERCKNYLSNTQGRMDKAFQEIECDFAIKAIQDDTDVRSRQVLIEAINKFLKKIPPQVDYTEEEQLTYLSYHKQFEQNNVKAEEFFSDCIENQFKIIHNKPVCRASADVVLAKLLLDSENSEKLTTEDGASTKIKNKEYYQRYFINNPEKIDELLNGRCKVIFADSWYHADPNLADKECDEALLMSQRIQLQSAANTLVQQRQQNKDKAYFLNNLSQAEEIATQCQRGKIVNIDECETAMIVVSDKKIEESKHIEYKVYYRAHPLAAKFFIKFCKSSMLNFNIKCQAADEAVKENNNRKLKIYDEAIMIQNINKLKNNLPAVQEILNKKCKLLFTDPWYYLDEHIRDEECDAAAEIARVAVDKKEVSGVGN